ncbi:MAG: hypothetical protein ACYCXG_11555 [Acidiferrobacter sp.]
MMMSRLGSSVLLIVLLALPGVVWAQPAPAAPAALPTAQAAQWAHQVHKLRRHIWRLRMRRRQFIADGLPFRAHRVHERIIRLGWQLRRVQAAERALTH